MMETKNNRKNAKKQFEHVQPPVRYLRTTISIRSFSDQISKFISENFRGLYEYDLCNVMYRELYLAVDGFARFLKLNFVCAALNLQYVRIHTEIDGNTFKFIMNYNTDHISDAYKANMDVAAMRSGFTYTVEPEGVIAMMPTAINPALDLSAMTKNVLYNSLTRIFFMEDEPFVIPKIDGE